MGDFMQIAVISDIHGNAIALEAVLKDIDTRDVDLVLCGGDLAGDGAMPNEVIGVIRKMHIPTIMGNYDDGVGYFRPECGCAYKDERAAELGRRSLAWMKEHITPENKEYLRGLLHRLEFTVFDKKVLLVHGSPRKINEYLYQDRPDESILRLINQENVDILICGHTHLPYIKNIGNKYLVNAGSVGKPKDGDTRAGYAVITIKENQVEAEFIRVAYDVEAMVRAIEDTDLPHEFAVMLRKANG
jgi:putative phosphoesterase